ncbi:hypothetical protein OV203_43600 [Nannocystis sp. ILAH1]|uniref:hypothetical protein n=1 Tax=Nannocystis sp. ILAH1 TaxID=2996789 RepID=UPI00226DC424|nr:hypothetical protein [Nannocystis sp. ILAH1]MCY0994094.1 hypothetical protein [Nannocystis sp. ILAH1]
MTSFRIASLLPPVLGLGLLFAAGAAEASSGALKGTLRFVNKNGGFCPTGENCLGAAYPQTSYNKLTGIPEVRIQLIRASDGFLLGSGNTNSAGQYTITWSTQDATTSDVTAYLKVRYVHYQNRFLFHQLSTTTHKEWEGKTANFTLDHGTTTGAPQLNWGNWDWGTVTTDRIANLYWAAYMMWAKLKLSPRMVSYFINVDILAFEKLKGSVPVTDSTCQGTSCARPWMKNIDPPTRPNWAEKKLTIVLDGVAATPYKPQSRMMHEMGHIADFVSGPQAGLLRQVGYCYDEASNCGWHTWSAEYRPTALSEGMATFLAVSAFHNGDATAAYVCDANGNSTKPYERHCYPNTGHPSSESIEDRAPGMCLAPEGRRALNAMRFFWDIYDTHADGTDATDLDFISILDSQAVWPCPSYPACYAAGELHDQFTSVQTTLHSWVAGAGTQKDEGNAWRFRNNMLNNYTGNPDVQGVYNQNCMGAN